MRRPSFRWIREFFRDGLSRHRCPGESSQGWSWNHRSPPAHTEFLPRGYPSGWWWKPQARLHWCHLRSSLRSGNVPLQIILWSAVRYCWSCRLWWLHRFRDGNAPSGAAAHSQRYSRYRCCRSSRWHHGQILYGRERSRYCGLLCHILSPCWILPYRLFSYPGGNDSPFRKDYKSFYTLKIYKNII